MSETKSIMCRRLLKTNPMPQKWFFKSDFAERGRQFINYKTTEPNDYHTIVDLNDDHFFLECMQCIDVSENHWNICDHCNDCIFSDNCPHRKEKK